MGTGVCSRRQKSLLHTALCLLAVLGLGGGLYLYNYVQDKTRSSEVQAMKFKQQHEALSAQLQVVYEHRSRLERSLQKEKGEHKKTKEDYLVYKLEAQEALNKEKQDSMNRYGALTSQQKILKNQNEEIKKQLSDLQVEHGSLKLEHRKTIELHNQQVSQLKRDKDNEILNLQDTISKLREESKLLRKAHQDVHSQLLSAQAQMEEFRQLKDALKRMPSFKDPGTSTQNQHSLPPSKDEKPAVSPHVQQPPQHPAVHKGVLPDLPGALDKKTPTANVLVAKEQVPVHSWQDIVSKVNARMTKEESNKVDGSDGLVKTQTLHANVAVGKWENRAMHRGYLRRIGDNEAEMDAGVIDREDGPPPMKQHVGQEALAQEDAADPAKDPNNQGEDEYEEAEIDRPAFEEKANAEKQPAQPEVDRPMEPDAELKSREEAEDRYQDDQEQEIDERGGEPENGDDLELVQDEEVVKVDTRNGKEGYY
ncbi:Golgi integral membrane protein 4-like isoform X6 [Rana temporaria]|uniref:Golgi integral membrane protein 4-like isoform X6 n=1 Tax=Rana temporaria TaxID=8407 RepID=UPI001AACD274|nr:Golgi integral membrane protein 4-like isoform X6 [Rana temporaria]